MQALSGSVSSVYALEGEALELHHILSIQNEEMSHASMINDEMKTSWNHLTSAMPRFARNGAWRK